MPRRSACHSTHRGPPGRRCVGAASLPLAAHLVNPTSANLAPSSRVSSTLEACGSMLGGSTRVSTSAAREQACRHGTARWRVCLPRPAAAAVQESQRKKDKKQAATYLEIEVGELGAAAGGVMKRGCGAQDYCRPLTRAVQPMPCPAALTTPAMQRIPLGSSYALPCDSDSPQKRACREPALAGRIGCRHAHAGRIGCRHAHAGRIGCRHAHAGRIGCRHAHAGRIGCRHAHAGRGHLCR